MRALAAGVLLCLVLAIPAGPGWGGEARRGGGPVWVIELADTVNPGSAEFLHQGLTEAAQADAACVVIMLDTPGGSVDSMRRMVRDILACPAPVVVFVAPAGARAASAGAFLVLAAPLAAAAPAANLGAAHPVGAGGKDIKGVMAGKIMSDLKALARTLAKRRGRNPELAEKMVTESLSLDASQALASGLLDLTAPNLGALLSRIQGREAATASGTARIDVAGKPLRYFKPDLRYRLLSFLANPNLAYILMMIGMMGLFFELSNPGSILPGVVGGVCLVLALFAMSALPVSYTGLALIGLAVVFFIVEIKVAGKGLLALAGAVSLVLGSLMLFDSPDDLVRVSLSVLIPVAAGVTAFFLGVTYLALRAQLGRSATGAEGMAGQKAVVVDSDRVRVMGELWRARGAEGLPPGSEVVVREVEGLLLKVEPLDGRPKGKP